jgi:general secretion pathway protein D
MLRPLLAIWIFVTGIDMAADDPEKLLERARKAEADGNKARAYVLYQRAAAANPSDPAIWARMRALRGNFPPTPSTGPMEDPGPPPEVLIPGLTGVLSLKDLVDGRRLDGPMRLTAAKPGKKSFHVRGEAKKLFEDIAREFGLVAIFERDLATAPPSPAIRFDIEDADYRTVLQALSTATNTFAVPISERIVLVAQDTAAKRQEYEPTVTRVFPIPQRTSVQEAQELSQAIQQTLEVRRIVVDPTKRQILIRDRARKVDIAALLLEDMANYKPQIEIELELLTAGKSRSLNFGVTLPNSTQLINFGKVTDSIGFQGSSTFTNFLAFGGGKTFLGIGLAGAELLGTYTKTESTSVVKTHVVASDGQSATMHIGDKYPIITNQYLGATAAPGQNTFAPAPTVNFEELGLVMKVTPWVHGMDEVTLEIEAEFKVLGTGGFNGIPVINTRKFQSKLRLKTSEWAVVAGLVTDNETRTLSGIAGLATVPILGQVFSRNGKDQDESTSLVVIKPRIISTPPSERITRMYWFGSETKPNSPL